MAIALKTKSPKGRGVSKAKIYEHTENIEPVATKEFVRQELKTELEPIKRDIAWLRWVMGGGFALLLTVIIYLHSDTKTEIRDMKTEIRDMKTEIRDMNRKIDRALSGK